MKHQNCRIALAVAAVAVSVFLSACDSSQDSTDNVFDAAEDAIATDSTASNITTAQFEYEFDEGDTATIRFQAPDNVRIDVLEGEDSAVFCLNGDAGWMYVRGDVFDMTDDDIKEMQGALLQTIPFKADFQEIFTDAKLLPETEDVCGEECKVISTVFRIEPNIKAKIWIGKDTDLLRQFEFAGEDGVYTTQYFDYATFDDITIPSEMFRFTPEGAFKLSLVSFETNTEIDESVFRKPEILSATEGDK
jgi:hypothetical protein